MSFWKKGPGAMKVKREQDVPAALPIFSVDTIEEAKQILVHFGKKSYDGKAYYWPLFSGGVTELPAIMDQIQEYYESAMKGPA